MFRCGNRRGEHLSVPGTWTSSDIPPLRKRAAQDRKGFRRLGSARLLRRDRTVLPPSISLSSIRHPTIDIRSRQERAAGQYHSLFGCLGLFTNTRARPVMF